MDSTVGNHSRFLPMPDADKDSRIVFADPGDDSCTSGEEMEEGLNGMVPWPDRIPRIFPAPGHESKGDIQPTPRPRQCVHQGNRLARSVALLHRRQGVRQRALSASAATPSGSDTGTGYESESSTTTEDLSTTASLSSIGGGSEIGALCSEPIAEEKRHLVSL